jgi:hypothetical protein
MSQEETKAVGLQCLTDEALAQIIEQDLDEKGELKFAGEAAFAELVRRTPQQ